MRGRTAVVLGVPVDDVTMAEAVSWICDFVEVGRRTGRTHQVTTVNADFVVNTLDDPGGLALLQHAELSIPDGMPVVWGSKLLGTALRERVTGADLLPALVAAAEAKGYSVYLFGAGSGIAERAAAVLRAKHPDATIVGDAGPVLGPDAAMDSRGLDVIRAARPDIVCVALGNPKQERWIARHRDQLGAPVLIGVGGTLDLVVGEKRRAPAWLGRLGLEWVFRAVQEPRRLVRRYAHDIVTFLPRLARQAWSFRSAKAAPFASPEIRAHGTAVVLRPRGRLTHAALNAAGLEAALAPGGRIVVDLASVPFVDNETANALAHLARSAWRTGAEVHVGAVGDGAERCLAGLRVDHLLPRWPGRPDEVFGSPADPRSHP